jgi:polyphosphate kinase
LTAYAEHPSYSPLLVSPLSLAEKTLALIAREADHSRAGRPARIIAKINSLLDRTVIQELYRASQAGVEIDLIVRGICALRPGIRGVSDRIRVRSIVGRFLEHTRIFYFANGGEEEIYLGSADWMARNLYQRVEVLFPVLDPALRRRIRHEILEAFLRDTLKARLLRADATYVRADAGRRKTDTAFSAQDFFISVAEGKAGADSIPREAVRRPRRDLATKAE